MEAARERNSALIEIEALQNDLIERLDDLDRRVREVLKQCSSTRQSDLPTNPSAPATDSVPLETTAGSLDAALGGATLGDPGVPTC